MFKRLQVKNYVLIDSLEIEFPEGLVIITGQTGAGKSIIIGSIGLVLGAKTDSSIIGEAGDNCVVEAEFDVDEGNETLRTLLEDSGAEWDGGHLIIRRVVSRSGRSRAFVNDCPFPVGSLSSLSSSLIDIHSQHQTLLLSDRKFQLSALDHYAGNGALLRECGKAWTVYNATKAEIEVLDAKIKRAEQENDYDRARFSQLDSAALKEGELEELEAEQKQLSNAEDIKENLFAVEDLFSPDESSEDRISLDGALRESERRLEKVAPYVAAADGLKERVTSARVELDDILSEIERINARIEVSQERLTIVEDRISLIYSLLQKFSCRTVSELIALRDELASMLRDSSELMEKRTALAKVMEVQYAELESLAGKLHQGRQKAAPGFAAAIEESLHYLELQYAVFEVELLDADLSATGRDAVMFKFSASGKNAVDVAKCASGGEMSRIMLCLKDMMARYTNMPTMIFDEIDTGVSGSAADKMGSMICGMGDNMQVFAITHQPQVAAKGKAHYIVSKSIDPATGKSVTAISRLSEQDRVLEVARMLSGSTITDAAIANAKELLSN